ncbi:hypothetical protein Nepgr_027570 [Nepenthes gracilis]|uniref:Retrotransposon gag domain-containing protein n=1 Tax=Nepenthes gracilis TaxID=150966 RepID=A0AAD3TBZ0_NEPGR|nr:hypothetical protein Nepgr_027570 [Nepenthes gracilis]
MHVDVSNTQAHQRASTVGLHQRKGPKYKARRRGGQRKKALAQRTGRLTSAPTPISSHAQHRFRREERETSITPDESPERRNSRYSRAESRTQAQEEPPGPRDQPERSANAILAYQRLEKIWNRVFKDDERTANIDRSSFTTEILNHPMLAKFKMPARLLQWECGLCRPSRLLPYPSGSTGAGRRSHVLLLPPHTKRGHTHWFHNLPLDSIRSFQELVDIFLSQYASSRREEKQPWHLSHIKQKRGENPQSFISALAHEEFFRHLAHKNSQTFQEVEAITKAYAAVEEANETKRPDRPKQPRSFPSERKRKHNGGNYSHQKSHKSGPPEHKDHGSISLTPLTDMLSNVLMQIRGEKFLKWPKPLKKVEGGTPVKFVNGPGQSSSNTGGEGSGASPPRNRVAVGVVNMITTRPVKTPADNWDQYARRKKQHTTNNVISFSDDDLAHVVFSHADPLVSALISDGSVDYQMKRVFIDNESSRDFLYLGAFFKLGLKRRQLKSAEGQLYGLDNESVLIQGTIRLEVTLGMYPRMTSRTLTFLVVNLPSVYNVILGRPCLTTFGPLLSIPHLKIKFSMPYGVGEILGDQVTGRTCYMSQIAPNNRTITMGELDHRDETTLQQAQSGEETNLVPLNLDDPKRPEMVHKLGLDPDQKPVRQKQRNHSIKKLIAIREEVKQLLEVGSIREVQYPNWLSNVVLVKKSDEKWRICVDFTDVNKAYPKDSFPLPRIDLLMNSTSGYELLSFMDAYSGYN